MTHRQALDKSCDLILARFAPEYALELLAEIVAQASNFWYADGIDPGDFCLQSNPTSFSGAIVFGGTNRLIWSPRNGFHPDQSYCNPRFLEHAKHLRSIGS